MNRNVLIGLALILALVTASCLDRTTPTPTAAVVTEAVPASPATSMAEKSTSLSNQMRVDSLLPHSAFTQTPTPTSLPSSTPTPTETFNPTPPTPIHPTITALDAGEALPIDWDFLFVARGNLLRGTPAPGKSKQW